jgi:hypothetical protein
VDVPPARWVCGLLVPRCDGSTPRSFFGNRLELDRLGAFKYAELAAECFLDSIRREVGGLALARCLAFDVELRNRCQHHCHATHEVTIATRTQTFVESNVHVTELFRVPLEARSENGDRS